MRLDLIVRGWRIADVLVCWSDLDGWRRGLEISFRDHQPSSGNPGRTGLDKRIHARIHALGPSNHLLRINPPYTPYGAPSESRFLSKAHPVDSFDSDLDRSTSTFTFDHRWVKYTNLHYSHHTYIVHVYQ